MKTRIALLAACLALFVAAPMDLTKTGPDTPTVEFFHGGGGGP